MPTKKHPLAHLIPAAEFAEDYISRVIFGVRDLALLRYAKEAERNIYLEGPTGPGKTSLVLAYAAEEKLPLVTLHCNGGLDPQSIFGVPVMDSDGKVKFVESDMTTLIRHGQGILYLDEANFMPPKLTASLHGLLDKRREITLIDKGGELVKAGEGLQIISTFNPDYEGTRPLNPAFKNRFALKVPFGYDDGVEKKLLAMPVTMEMARKLRESKRLGVIDTPVSTNMLIEFEEFCIDLGVEFAIGNFLAAFSAAEHSAVRDAVEMLKGRIVAEAAEMEAALD